MTPCVNNASRYHRWVLDPSGTRTPKPSGTGGGRGSWICHYSGGLAEAGDAGRGGDLADLTVPPGNRLEKLAGDRAGQHSIRINRQWRICFRWTDAGPEDVEITDYH